MCPRARLAPGRARVWRRREGCSSNRRRPGEPDNFLSRFPCAHARLDAVLSEDCAALLLACAAEPHDERQLHLQPVAGDDDALGHFVAASDAAENVDEHSLDARVHEDDSQGVFNDLGFRASADVAKVLRLSTATLDEIDRTHTKPHPTTDDADLPAAPDVSDSA